MDKQWETINNITTCTWYVTTWYVTTWYVTTWYVTTWYVATWYVTTWYVNTWYDYDYEIDLLGHIIKKHNKVHKQ